MSMTEHEIAIQLWNDLYDKMHDGASRSHLIGVVQVALEAHAADAHKAALMEAADFFPGTWVADEIRTLADKPAGAKP